MVEFYPNFYSLSSPTFGAFTTPLATDTAGLGGQDFLFPGLGTNFFSAYNFNFNPSMFSFKPSFYQNNYFDKGFNTKTNLPQLKDVYNPKLSLKLASIANKNAQQTSTIGRCAHEVNDTLEEGKFARGETRANSAYQVASKLADNKNFKQVNIPREDLKNLPAGCVVVWDRSAGHEHGHIAVTLGDGKEASDHTQMLSSRKANYAVFVPTGGGDINNLA